MDCPGFSTYTPENSIQVVFGFPSRHPRGLRAYLLVKVMAGMAANIELGCFIASSSYFTVSFWRDDFDNVIL